MARAYSQDLRDRVIRAWRSGTPARQAAARFGIGVATAIVWVRRARETGERTPRRQGQPKRSKLDPHREFLLGLIAETPDMTLAEMQERLRQQGVSASIGTIWTFLDRCGLTVKKSLLMRRSRLGRMFWSGARPGSRASSTSTQSGSSSSTRRERRPTWRACADGLQEANGCGPAFPRAIGKPRPSWPA